MPNAKGVMLLQIVKVLRANKAAAQALLPRRLAHYLSERIIVTNWYPEEDYYALTLVVGKVLGGGASDVWDMLGQMTAADDFAGFYKTMLWKDNPHGMLKNLRELWRIHHDTGRVEVRRLGEHEAIIEIHEYALVAREICVAVGGYCRAGMTMALGREPESRKIHCRSRGDDRCAWHMRWAPGGGK